MHQSSIKIFDNLSVQYPKLSHVGVLIYSACEIIVNCYSKGGKVLVCGNGGSAVDALHIVGELMKEFAIRRPLLPTENIYSEYLNNHLQRALPAISLVGEIALNTAYANDAAADLVFAQQVHGYGRKGDVLIAISTSGNSKNVLYAAEVAVAKKIKVIALTGQDGGKLKDLSDIAICVPETETYKIQELHLPVYHALCMAVENEFFGSKE